MREMDDQTNPSQYSKTLHTFLLVRMLYFHYDIDAYYLGSEILSIMITSCLHESIKNLNPKISLTVQCQFSFGIKIRLQLI